jgi:predicted trehalose synthase
MRLIAEQLWAQVTGRLSSAEVTQSIAHLRLQLAEHYRLQHDSLVSQKEELLHMGERVQLQHETLVEQRGKLKTWACTQQAEIERQAQRLVTRELELDEQQQRIENLQQQWLQERRQYEQQIRELVQQRDRPLAAA